MSEKKQQSLRCEAELVLVPYPTLCPVARRRERLGQSACYSCGADGATLVPLCYLLSPCVCR